MPTHFPQSSASRPTPRHIATRGFTLVEILVVIVIIGILAGLAIPAISGAVRRATITAQKLEVDTLARAVEQYREKYGDYPPDGSDQNVLQRHMRRLFPRMAEPDLTLLNRLTDNSTNQTAGTFSGVAMDRGEALVFFLGGFSSDTQHPITGPGGPLEYKPTQSMPQRDDIRNYQYNATRENSFFDFSPTRLTMARASDTAPMLSTDEFLIGNTTAIFGYSAALSDPLPSYLANDDEPTPIVYFDSRSYGVIGIDTSVMPNRNIYNGYLTGVGDSSKYMGGIRPYKTSVGAEGPSGSTYGTEAEAFAAVKFHNVDTFQIISPGSDGIFGAIVSTSSGDAGASPTIHFTTETGQPVQPLFSATSTAGLVFTSSQLGGEGFQDSQWQSSLSVNGHLDNVTNFSNADLESDLQ